MRRGSTCRRVRLLSALATAILLLAGTLPGQVLAVDGDRPAELVHRVTGSSNATVAYAALSATERLALRQYLTVASIKDRSSLSPAVGSVGGISTLATTCWTWTWQRDGLNIFGAVLWSYFQRIDWCGNGSTITSSPHGVQRTRWGEVYFPFWSWRHVGNQTWGGVGSQTYRAWTQGEFRLCLPIDIGCAQYAYPWLDMTAWADGRGTGTVGG